MEGHDWGSLHLKLNGIGAIKKIWGLPKHYSEALNWRTYNTITKDKRQTMIHKVLYRTLNIDQQQQNTRSELKCSVGQAVPVPLVAEVVLLLLKTGDKSWKRKGGRDCDHKEWTMSVVICDIRSDGFNLITRNPWFSSFPVSTNLVYTTYRWAVYVLLSLYLLEVHIK